MHNNHYGALKSHPSLDDPRNIVTKAKYTGLPSVSFNSPRPLHPHFNKGRFNHHLMPDVDVNRDRPSRPVNFLPVDGIDFN